MTSRFTVLVSFPTPRSTSVNPYTILLAEHIRRAGAKVLYFDWMTALSGDYDVFHVHWPENLVGGRTPLRRLVRQGLTLLILLRLTLTRRALVRTLHNLELPDGLSARQRWILRLIDRRTDLYIRLSTFTPVSPNKPAVMIPHPHFREWFAAFERAEPVNGQIGYVGRIRRYKGVETLLAALAETPELTGRVAGYPSSTELQRTVTDLAGIDGRIALAFGFIPDSLLVDVVTSSELVVLPYRLMHNSAAVLTALSLDRPVLVPRNPTTLALATESGAGWVHTFPGELRAEHLREALSALRAAPPAAPPSLERRSWTRTTRSHIEAYSRAIRIARYARGRVGYPRSAAT